MHKANNARGMLTFHSTEVIHTLYHIHTTITALDLDYDSRERTQPTSSLMTSESSSSSLLSSSSSRSNISSPLVAPNVSTPPVPRDPHMTIWDFGDVLFSCVQITLSAKMDKQNKHKLSWSIKLSWNYQNNLLLRSVASSSPSAAPRKVQLSPLILLGMHSVLLAILEIHVSNSTSSY